MHMDEWWDNLWCLQDILNMKKMFSWHTANIICTFSLVPTETRPNSGSIDDDSIAVRYSQNSTDQSKSQHMLLLHIVLANATTLNEASGKTMKNQF